MWVAPTKSPHRLRPLRVVWCTFNSPLDDKSAVVFAHRLRSLALRSSGSRNVTMACRNSNSVVGCHSPFTVALGDFFGEQVRLIFKSAVAGNTNGGLTTGKLARSECFYKCACS